MPSAAAKLDEQGVIQLTGDLVFATVTPLLAELDRQLGQGDDRVIDLSGVADVDSAGLALLLELLERARNRDIILSFRALSQDMLNIARLSNVEKLLPVAS